MAGTSNAPEPGFGPTLLLVLIVAALMLLPSIPLTFRNIGAISPLNPPSAGWSAPTESSLTARSSHPASGLGEFAPGVLNFEKMSIGVGASPQGIAYDGANGLLYVADDNGNNVTLINGSTEKTAGSISAGAGPWAVAIDSSNGRIFVTDDGSGNVTVINGTTNQPMGSISVGGSPTGIAFDPKNGYLYVTDGSLPGHVVILNGSNDSVVGKVAVGNVPWGIAFDPSNGFVYAVNYASDTVTAVNASSGMVASSIPVGSYPQQVAVSPGTGQVYVSNNGGKNVTVINGTTTIASISVGQVPEGEAFDASNGFLFVANGVSNNVSVVNVSSDLVVGSVTVGSSPQGVAYDASNLGVYVTDGGSNAVTVIAPPVGVQIEPTSYATDNGTPVELSARPFGGLPPYVSFNWSFGDGSWTNGTANQTSHSYRTPGTYESSVSVSDSHGYHSNETATITVNPPPQASAPSATPQSVDPGENLSLITSPSSGTPPYVRYSWRGLPTVCPSSTSAPNVTCRPTSPGTVRVSVAVTDSVGVTSPWSTGTSLTVNDPLRISQPVANRSVGYVGQWIDFLTGATGGSGGTSYLWIGLPPGCQNTGDPVMCQLTTPGQFNVTVRAEDSDGTMTGESPTLLFPVLTDVTVALVANRTAIDAGESISFNATASGGAGTLSYDWTGLPSDCPSSNASRVTCSPLTGGTFQVEVNVTDSNGFSADSRAVSLLVHASLSGTVHGPSSSVTVGSFVTLLASPEGGSGDYGYAWKLGDGSSSTGASVTHAYALSGTYGVLAWINDSLGSSVLCHWNVTVVSPSGRSSGNSLLGLPVLSGIALIAGITAAIAVATLVIWRIRKR